MNSIPPTRRVSADPGYGSINPLILRDADIPRSSYQQRLLRNQRAVLYHAQALLEQTVNLLLAEGDFQGLSSTREAASHMQYTVTFPHPDEDQYRLNGLWLSLLNKKKSFDEVAFIVNKKRVKAIEESCFRVTVNNTLVFHVGSAFIPRGQNPSLKLVQPVNTQEIPGVSQALDGKTYDGIEKDYIRNLKDAYARTTAFNRAF